MNKQPSSSNPSTTEQILDLLLDALLERQAARQRKPDLGQEILPSPPAPQPATPPPPTSKPTTTPSAPEPAAEEPAAAKPVPAPEPLAEPSTAGVEPRRPLVRSERFELYERESPALEAKHRRELRPGEEGWTPPPPLPSINLGPTLGRLLLSLAILVVLVNVPINRYGTALARIMPDSAALVIRDGLVLKGSGPEIYVLQDNKLRWISSLEAFEYFGYRWEQVRIVDDSFLEEFEKGQPIHVLLKCQGSPHIYALENGKKRWIKDIPTFEAEGYVWDDVKFVDCSYLRNLPDGPSIPEDAGPPPQP